MTCAIVVAAGRSRRMGVDKLFTPLLGHPVVFWSIQTFQRLPEIDRILVVTRPDRYEDLVALTRANGLTKVAPPLIGGRERHDSVWAGLQAMDPHTRLVAVHDGARPLVTPSTIRRCLALARQHGAASVATPVSDTLKRADDQMRVAGDIDRRDAWAMQTPQIFHANLLLDAYQQVMDRGELVTDETSAVSRLGHPIHLCPADSFNPKITYPEDLALAAHILATRADPH